MSNLLDVSKEQEEATRGEEAKLERLQALQKECSKEIETILKKYNCTLTATITIDITGNYPKVQIISKELFNAHTQNSK